jgi:hypothetical protein
MSGNPASSSSSASPATSSPYQTIIDPTLSPDVSLQYAFIFDRRLDAVDEGAGEDEKLEQVLFFWPPQTSAFHQLMRVGLATGVMSFCRAFSGEDVVDGVQMEAQYYTFLECEPDIWMVWVVSNPRKLEGFGGRRGAVLSKTRQVDHVFNPHTLREHMRGIHGIYRLFHGSLRSRIAPGGDLSTMHRLMEVRRDLRKAREMSEKIAEGAVTSTDANLARAAQVPGLEAELLAQEAASTVTAVRRQLRQVVGQFLTDDFTKRWDHHSFAYQTAVTRCAVERFTYLSVHYFTSTVKTGESVGGVRGDRGNTKRDAARTAVTTTTTTTTTPLVRHHRHHHKPSTCTTQPSLPRCWGRLSMQFSSPVCTS